MTKWISVEEAAERYQIPSRRIYEWRKRREVTFSSVSNLILLDEDSLVNCIQRNFRQSLSENEFKHRMDEKMKGREEDLFVFQSLKELTPLSRIVIKELAGLIQNDERRELFLFAALRGSLKDYAARKDKTYREVQAIYQSIIREVKSRGEFLKTYKAEKTLLKAKIRSYEMKNGGQPLSLPDYFVEKKWQESQTGGSGEREIPKEIVVLLNTPIQNIEFDARAQRIIIDAGMETLRDLLRFTRKHGFSKLLELKQFGEGTLLKVQLRLKRMSILDAENNCYLYKYIGQDNL